MANQNTPNNDSQLKISAQKVISPVFSLRGVRQTKETQTVLNDIDLEIETGKITALIGPSGAGKTSLLRLLNRLDDPAGGQIFYRSRPIAEYPVQAGGVDASEILWREAGNTRNGLYFIERGFGLRVPDSCFDRANTAISHLKIGDIDWRRIFATEKTRWFHTGGIFTGLSETVPQVALEAVKIAKENGAIVSYDLNYRHSLWKNRGGKEAANKLNREFLPFADVVFGVISDDFVPSVNEFDEQKFQTAAEKMRQDFPNLQTIVSTLRDTHNASSHNFGAACYADGQVVIADKYINTNVLDRVGSGDAFVSGFIYGVLSGKDTKYSINCGAAHGVLVMTTVGDNSTATIGEIEHLMRGESSAAKR